MNTQTPDRKAELHEILDEIIKERGTGFVSDVLSKS